MNPEPFASPLAQGTYRLDAGAMLDASESGLGRGAQSLLISVETAGWRVLMLGTSAEADRHEASAAARTIDFRDHLVTPAFVNAHTHLDLTHVGPQPPDPHGFPAFVQLVRERRLTETDALHRSVLLGAQLSRAGGVVAVGDVGGAVAGRASLEPLHALRKSGLQGVSYLEFFAVGESVTRAMARVRELLEQEAASTAPTASGVRLGLQPHAPYSVEPLGYEQAIELAAGRPMATHLAESPAEHEFIAHRSGPQRRLLESLGLWNSSLNQVFGEGRTPVEHLVRVLRERFWAGPMLFVHLNDLLDSDIDLLAELNQSHRIHVAYCPRASEYFRAAEAFGPHRYRDLLARGINVCLGTDSIINLWSEEKPAGGRISPLDEARLLARRDNTPTRELLAMLTVRGARALDLEESSFLLQEGSRLSGVCAFPISAELLRGPAIGAWESVLAGDAAPRLVC